VAFSRDGKTLASASRDKTVRLWDTATGTPRQTLKGHSGPVNSVAFSRDGNTLASASDDKSVRLWDTGAGKSRQTLDLGFTIRLTFDSSGTQLLTDLGTINLFPDYVASKVTTPEHPPVRPVINGYGLNSEQTWVVKDDERIIWLPPEYRPTASAVRNSVICIGCDSGRVIWILALEP
jgi:WD40 repeat protein